MLAGFIGFEVIRRITPLLHTPLMSLTNALDAIAVVGAILLAGEHKSTLSTVLGTIAIIAPTTLLVAAIIAIVPSTAESGLLFSPARTMAPTRAMASSALVSDINGVWSSGVIRRMTSKPMNPASIKT